MSKELLLVSCSAKKSKEAGKAKDVYKGTLYPDVFILAEKRGWEVLILSAKHGFITPETFIEPYDEKFKKCYQGDWPEGSGYYIGSALYFGNAPARFKPLLSNLASGYMRQALLGLIKGEPVSTEVMGVVALIEHLLLTERLTKEQMYLKICEYYGYEKEGFKATISSQVRPGRIALRRGLTLTKHSDGSWSAIKNSCQS